jgi:hypothetical protein
VGNVAALGDEVEKPHTPCTSRGTEWRVASTLHNTLHRHMPGSGPRPRSTSGGSCYRRVYQTGFEK